MGSRDIQVKDKIVRFGKVYEIFKIKNKKIEDKEEKIIYFKPIYKHDQKCEIVCSIPLKNLKKTKIRKPLMKDELLKLLKYVSKRPKKKKTKVDLNRSKKHLISNDPKKITKVLKKLWLDKQNEDTNFTPSKRAAFNVAINRLKEEVAYVFDISIKEATEILKNTIKGEMPPQLEA